MKFSEDGPPPGLVSIKPVTFSSEPIDQDQDSPYHHHSIESMTREDASLPSTDMTTEPAGLVSTRTMSFPTEDAMNDRLVVW